MGSDGLGVLDSAAVFQVRRDPRRTKGMTADHRGEIGFRRPPFH